jgi:cullin 1
MHGLLGRIPEGLDPLRAHFEVATRDSGLSAIESIAGDKPDAVEPKAYVDAILGVYEKYSDLVKKSFRGEAGFNAALDKACREFINQNAITGKSSQKSPELLAKYSDQLLKKTNKVGEETDLNIALVQTVSLLQPSIQATPEFSTRRPSADYFFWLCLVGQMMSFFCVDDCVQVH